MRVRLAVAVALILVVAAAVVTFSKSKQRLAWSNALVVASGHDVPLGPGKRNCQPEGIPEDTSELRVFVASRARVAGPLDATIRHGGRDVARARFGMVRDASPSIARVVPTVKDEVAGAQVCFHNRGPSELRLAGDRTPIAFSGANPYGTIFDDEPRVDYLRPGKESWWELAGTVAERFGRSKTSFSGPWTMWAMFTLLAATWSAALFLLLRRLPER